MGERKLKIKARARNEVDRGNKYVGAACRDNSHTTSIVTILPLIFFFPSNCSDRCFGERIMKGKLRVIQTP